MRQTPSRPRQAGFTILEILIAIGIIAILVSIVVVAINVVKNNAAKRATVTAMGVAQNLMAEFETTSAIPGAVRIDSGAPALSTFDDRPNFNLAQDQSTCRIAMLLLGVPKNRTVLQNMSASAVTRVDAPEWGIDIRYVVGDVVKVVPSGLYYRCTVAHTSTTPPPNANWVVTTLPDALVPVDGWGMGLKFVGLGLTGTDYTAAATITAPNQRPFWVSAGPDRNFQTHDDNIYSFEN